MNTSGLRAFKDVKAELFGAAIAAYNGSLVKTTGEANGVGAQLERALEIRNLFRLCAP